jgi:DNA-binding NarL/FixJ family response regulator
MIAALIAQRISDEDVRVRWFRGPLGRELSQLAGGPPSRDSAEQAAGGGGGDGGLGDDDTDLLWLLIEGQTNREIAARLGVSEDDVVRRLAEMYAKIGVSSRGEAAVFAFREEVL